MTQPRVHTVGRAYRSCHNLILSASLSVSVADPRSQIKTGDVAIHSKLLLHCIPSCIRDQCNRHISRFFVCCVPSDRTCAHCTFGAPASRRRPCITTLYVFLRSVRHRMFAKVFVSIIGSWTTQRHTRLHCALAAVSQSKTNVLLSVCFGSRQTRGCGSTGSAPSTGWSTGGP